MEVDQSLRDRGEAAEVGLTSSSTVKRPRLALSIHVEPGADGASAIHEVFADGSYTPASDSHYQRASEAASSFVSRALLEPNVDANGLDGLCRGSESNERKTTLKQFTTNHVSGENSGAEAADRAKTPEQSTNVTAESAEQNVSVAPAASAPMSVTSASTRDDLTDSRAWPSQVISSVEGSLSELGRAVAIIESLRSDEPLLHLNRFHQQSDLILPKTSDSLTGRNSSRLPASTLKNGGALLMSKRRALLNCSDVLNRCVAACREWCRDDKLFIATCAMLRKHCGALRRASDGIPLVDMADGEFSPIKRPASSLTLSPSHGKHDTCRHESGEALEDSSVSKRESMQPFARPCLSQKCTSNQPVVQPLPSVSLLYSISSHDQSMESVNDSASSRSCGRAQPQEMSDEPDEVLNSNCNVSLIRFVRKSRVDAFNAITFERMLREALRSSHDVEVISNSISVGCDLRHSLTIRQSASPSFHGQNAIHGAVCGESGAANMERMNGTASALALRTETVCTVFSLVASHCSLHASRQGEPLGNAIVLNQLKEVLHHRFTAQLLRRVLDQAAENLRVFVEWTRSQSCSTQEIVHIWALDMDGDGPKRMLATLEPQSKSSELDNEFRGNHVVVTPAFGIVVAAPDDPGSRSRAASFGAHTSTSTRSQQSNTILDDVPRGYLCPVDGGEILSVITLLLCVRLLDSFEGAARNSGATVFDVDRQCFSIIVHVPSTGRSLRAKVWPIGNEIGKEVPAVAVWLDNQRCTSFAGNGQSRLRAWKVFLAKIADGTGEATLDV